MGNIPKRFTEFFTGGESVRNAREVLNTPSLVESKKRKHATKVAAAKAITRRHAAKLVGTGLLGTACITLLGWQMFGSNGEPLQRENQPEDQPEMPDYLRPAKKAGAKVESYASADGNLNKNSLIAYGHYHKAPGGEQLLWKQFHNLFALLVDQYESGYMERLHVEGQPHNKNISLQDFHKTVLPMLQTQGGIDQIRERLVREPLFFQHFMKHKITSGQTPFDLKYTLLMMCPRLKVVGTEDPSLFQETDEYPQGKYMGFMKRHWQPNLEAMHPFANAINTLEFTSREQMLSMSYIEPERDSNGRVTTIRVAGQRFNADRVRAIMIKYLRLKSVVDEMSRQRSQYVFDRVSGHVVMGNSHLDDFREMSKDGNLARSVHLITVPGIEEYADAVEASDREFQQCVIDRIQALQSE